MGGGGDTSVRHPELASVRSVMRGNYERGKGNINVLDRESDSLYAM